jgi:hypothetical protein
MKGTFIVFDTDFIGTLKTGDIRDGKVLIDEKEYILSIPIEDDKTGKIVWHDAHPIRLRGRFGAEKPLWLLKWNSLFPVGFQVVKENKIFVNPENPNEVMNVDKKEIQVLEPKFKETKLLPEILGSTHDLRFLKSMKKYAGGEGMNLKKMIPIFIVIFIVGIIGYIMYYYYGKKGH